MNYKETIITGELNSWTRCRAVGVNNTYNQVPQIDFFEEVLTSLPNGKIISEQGSCLTTSMSDPLTEFDLLNPIDGSVIGTSKYQDVYILLYSLYLKLAQDRDVATMQPSTEPTQEIIV